MSPRRRASSRGLYAVRAAVRSVGSDQSVVADLAALRQQVEANTQQIEMNRALVEKTSAQVEGVVKELEALIQVLEDNGAGQLDWGRHRDEIERRLSKLSGVVSDLGEGVHFQRGAIVALESRFERLAGAVLDETALKRRLERIEDRILDVDSNDSLAPKTSKEHPDGGV